MALNAKRLTEPQFNHVVIASTRVDFLDFVFIYRFQTLGVFAEKMCMPMKAQTLLSGKAIAAPLSTELSTVSVDSMAEVCSGSARRPGPCR
jgi:hypothetical protein